MSRRLTGWACGLVLVPALAAGQNGSQPSIKAPPDAKAFSPTLEDVIYREELDALAGNGFDVVHTLTREQPPGWTGYSRRIDPELLAEVAWPASETPKVFVCGSTRFVDAAADGLVGLGYDPRWIRTERFGATG